MMSRRLVPNLAQLCVRCSRRNIHTTSIRNGGGHPRGIPLADRTYKVTVGRPPPDNVVWICGTVLALAGFTRLSYFMMAHFDHWTGGHHKLPDASKWTDEELGIPPDEEGLLKPESS
ncbi:uncharacterized protein LOC125676969 [Ostrea edulis]|uniref:uncharacterized protein LOC125676969 n=1 Tax=Ostrea edulis TaxID=37623 RepID=UPI0020946701|nr:uncharacterized protein LOC125676969 [Ostrea edulis]